MKALLISEFTFLLLMLTGCAEQAITPPLSENAYKAIAEDATHQLTLLYPPAQTHFQLASKEGGKFDQSFKVLLRNRGYALEEYLDKEPEQNAKAQKLSYILDALSDVSHYGYYRLTVNIGDKQLSRLYDVQDLKQPNYWSYRQ
jgi:hypothetical protein